MRFIASLAAVMSFGLAVTPALAFVAGKAAQADSHAAFQQIDTDRDGRLTRAEFDAARASTFSRADADRNGKLTVSEMRALVPAGAGGDRGARPNREQLERLRGIDGNGDRAIDTAEFGAIGERLFGRLDANRDGAVTPEEAGELGRSLGLGG